MPNMITDTRSVVGIRKRASTPRLAAYASTRGPAEVPPRQYQTRVTLSGYRGPFALGNMILIARPGTDTQVPFDPAEFAPNQGIYSGHPTPNPLFFSPPPAQCQDLGCDANPPQHTQDNPVPVASSPTVISPAPIQVPPPILIPSGQSQGPAAGIPVSTAPSATLVATGPSFTNAAATAAAAPSVWDNFTAWLQEQTIITGVPNWTIAAGGAALLFMFSKKK